MDHWRRDGQFLPWIKRFYIIWFLCSFPHNPITHAQIKHIWVYPVYILPDMADMATTETSKLEDIDIIICIRANFLGLYSVGSSWWSLDRSDTLEHCLICVSFNYFYMISVLKFIFTQEQTLFVRLKSFFFAVLTIGEVMFIPRSDKVSLKLGHRSHLLRHDRCTFPQFGLPLNSKMPVWLFSCMWYPSCRLSNNKVIGQFFTVFLDWPGCIIWWTVQGKVTIPSSTGG